MSQWTKSYGVTIIQIKPLQQYFHMHGTWIFFFWLLLLIRALKSQKMFKCDRIHFKKLKTRCSLCEMSSSLFLCLRQKPNYTQKLRICVHEEEGKDLTCARRPWIFPSYSNRVRHRLWSSSSCNDRECWRLEDNNNVLSHDTDEGNWRQEV